MTDAEKGSQLCSRLLKVLNVAQSYASGFDFACGRDGKGRVEARPGGWAGVVLSPFEHP